MFQLKVLSKEGIPGALDKAVRYRLLGQPREAESIYLDVLQVDPDHQPALVGLFLSLTDQFGQHGSDIFSRAHNVLPRLAGDYERAYYAGIYYERRAHAVLGQAVPGHLRMAYDLLREAMSSFEASEPLRRPGDDDSLLRWNACARLMMRHPRPEAEGEDRIEPYTDA